MRPLTLRKINFEKGLILLLIAALGLGFFLHFRNLFGAKFMDPDEARAMAMLPSGPFIYLLCRPLYALMQLEHSGFYTAAALGFGSILLFYLVTRKLFDRWNAVLSTLVFAFFPIRINFARSLYPAVFVDFFVLLLILVLVYVLMRKRYNAAIFAGMISAVLIAVHPFTYSVLFGIVLALILLWFFNRDKISLHEVRNFSFMYALGAIVWYFLLEQLFMRIKPGYIFTEQLLGFHSYSQDFTDVESFFGGLGRFLAVLHRIIFESPITIFRGIFVGFSVIFSLKVFFRRKKSPLFFFIIYGIGGVTALLAGDLLNVHGGLAHRVLIWLCPVVSMCIGYCCTEIFLKGSVVSKILVSVSFVLFMVSSVHISYLVTTETFKTEMINTWLKKNNIPKTFVVTNLHLREKDDTDGASMFPVRHHRKWTKTNHRYQILWPLLSEAYRRKMVFYIIPSGIGGFAHLEDGDAVFQGVSPVKSWPHPYSQFKYRFSFRGKSPDSYNCKINVYKLSDLFDMRRPLYKAKTKPN